MSVKFMFLMQFLTKQLYYPYEMGNFKRMSVKFMFLMQFLAKQLYYPYLMGNFKRLSVKFVSYAVSDNIYTTHTECH